MHLVALSARYCRCSYRYHYYPSYGTYWDSPVSGAHLTTTLLVLAGVFLVLAAVRMLRG